MQIKPLNPAPRPRGSFGPGEVAAIVLVLVLAVFAIMFGPTAGSSNGNSKANAEKMTQIKVPAMHEDLNSIGLDPIPMKIG